MAPYTLLPRDDDATATATDSSATSSASDASSSDSSSESSSSGSWVTTHKKDIYIAVAVVAVVLLLFLLFLGKKHRLTFWPFKQKRCSGSTSCGKGISKRAKVDKDYFENGSGGWRCLACQEKKEDSDIEKELEDTEEGDLDLKDAGRRKKGDEDDDDDDEERGERKVKTGSNKDTGSRTGNATKADTSRKEGGATRTRREEERPKPPARTKRDDDGQKRLPPKKKRDEASDDDESD